MPGNNQKYTRWRNQETDEDIDDETNRVDIPLERSEGDDEDDNVSMQEGRRALGMMTQSTNSDEMKYSRMTSARLICMMILFTLLVFGIGCLVGFAAGNGQSALPSVSVNCPVSTPTQSTPVPTTTVSVPSSIATTTTPRTTTTLKPEVEDTVASLASKVLSSLTTGLLKNYIKEISKFNSQDLRSFVESSFKRQGFTVLNQRFPVLTSVADVFNPNTVELVKMDNSTQVVNNATNSLKGFLPYSGFSPNGTATGALIYAHYGSKADFKTLEKLKIQTKDKILLIRQGGIHPSTQIYNAAKNGAIGVIFYPDPFDFGGNSTTNSTFPLGLGLPEDGVVWESLRAYPGDPSTLNYASQRDIFRLSPKNYDESMPKIPAHPVSSSTGRYLLKLLEGSDIPSEWSEKFPPGFIAKIGGQFNENVKQVRLTTHNILEERDENVLMAFPPARDHSKVVHLGCHYEMRGSQLTSSGISLAALLAFGEVIHRSFPNGTERLMMFTVFENKYGDSSAGTEYSQLFSWWLESSALAYIDFDSVLRGSGYVEANVSPILRDTVREAFHQVNWVGREGLKVLQGVLEVQPYRTSSSGNKTDLGFQESFKFSDPYECDESLNYVNLRGIPSVQLSAVSLNRSNLYHLHHSQYDTMDALIRLEDRDLLWTHMIVSSLSVTSVILSSFYLPPVRFDEVGWGLSNAWKSFVKDHKNELSLADPPIENLLDDVTSAFDSFLLSCESYDAWYKDGTHLDTEMSPQAKFRALENRLTQFMLFGRRFLRPRDVLGHSGFGSLLTFGPSRGDPCRGQYFPGLQWTLGGAAKKMSDWNDFRQELSLLLSTLIDFRTGQS